uniref:Uncharacterized protein n=1 Tax=Anguilla anguilla TaxID=7936 RepID=A0A0E9R6Z2_ANGAN
MLILPQYNKPAKQTIHMGTAHTKTPVMIHTIGVKVKVSHKLRFHTRWKCVWGSMDTHRFWGIWGKDNKNG